jgi:hypothetical protein
MWNSLLDRYKKDPLQATILLCVLFIHFAFVAIILVSPHFAFRKKTHKPLIVKTLTPSPTSKTSPIEKKSARSQVASAAKSDPKPQSVQQKKQEPPKSEIKKEPTPKPIREKKEVLQKTDSAKKEPAIADKVLSKSKTPAAKKNPPPPPQNRANISDSLLKELEESIAKIETKSDKGAASKKTPINSQAFTPISLQIDNPLSDDSTAEEGESSYPDTLASHLHRSLSLPDYGEVKIQLSLRQDGTVVKLIVLKTQSEKNRQYLESNLPRLQFPRFEGAYASKKEYTFILTFCNE